MLCQFFYFSLTTMERLVEFDPRMKHPLTFLVVGPMQCRETQFVLELIRRIRFIHPPSERI